MADSYSNYYENLYGTADTYRFVTPFVDEKWPTGEDFIVRFSLNHRGVCVIKNGAVYTERRYPSQDLLMAADAYYMGGHEYLIGDQEAADLVTAGYTPTLIV